MSLANKTMMNCTEMLEAIGERKSDKVRTDLEMQSLYVAASLDRCRRCGDHTVSLVPTPPLSLLCTDCEDTLKKTDAGLLWFSDLVARIGNDTT